MWHVAARTGRTCEKEKKRPHDDVLRCVSHLEFDQVERAAEVHAHDVAAGEVRAIVRAERAEHAEATARLLGATEHGEFATEPLDLHDLRNPKTERERERRTRKVRGGQPSSRLCLVCSDETRRALTRTTR